MGDHLKEVISRSQHDSSDMVLQVQGEKLLEY